jgi:recombination protein RecA
MHAMPEYGLEGEIGDAQMGLQARMMSPAMRKLKGGTTPPAIW